MSEFKGTPGPWLIDHKFICESKGKVVADITCAEVEVAYWGANMALIAASPDLLQVLQDLERMAGAGMMEDDPARVAARAAIAKALGQ